MFGDDLALRGFEQIQVLRCFAQTAESFVLDASSFW